MPAFMEEDSWYTVAWLLHNAGAGQRLPGRRGGQRLHGMGGGKSDVRRHHAAVLQCSRDAKAEAVDFFFFDR